MSAVSRTGDSATLTLVDDIERPVFSVLFQRGGLLKILVNNENRLLPFPTFLLTVHSSHSILHLAGRGKPLPLCT